MPLLTCFTCGAKTGRGPKALQAHIDAEHNGGKAQAATAKEKEAARG